VTAVALKQLQDDGKMNDAAVTNETGEFYNKPAMYAMKLYAFFLCFQCKEPFFFGANECGDEAQQHLNAATRVCLVCEEKRQEAKRREEEAKRREIERKQGEVAFQQNRKENNVRQCPECKAYVQKQSGCPHMTCRCGCHWCWLCGGKFDANTIYPHIGRNHPNGTEDQYRWD